MLFPAGDVTAAPGLRLQLLGLLLSECKMQSENTGVDVERIGGSLR